MPKRGSVQFLLLSLRSCATLGLNVAAAVGVVLVLGDDDDLARLRQLRVRHHERARPGERQRQDVLERYLSGSLILKLLPLRPIGGFLVH